MSATKPPARPGTERGDQETLTALRKHLSDEDAEMLAHRMISAERDEEHATDWHAVKRRLLRSTREA